MQEPSIFTKIINGEIPSHKVYEDERVIAFLELYPINEGHTLVVPKKQINHIWDLEDDDYQYLWSVAKKIALHMREVFEAPRIGVIVEGFGVPHTHIHLVPIYHGNDLKKPNAELGDPTQEELEAVAAKIRL
jgi:histidine triad (HIT) family protein